MKFSPASLLSKDRSARAILATVQGFFVALLLLSLIGCENRCDPEIKRISQLRFNSGESLLEIGVRDCRSNELHEFDAVLTTYGGTEVAIKGSDRWFRSLDGDRFYKQTDPLYDLGTFIQIWLDDFGNFECLKKNTGWAVK